MQMERVQNIVDIIQTLVTQKEKSPILVKELLSLFRSLTNEEINHLLTSGCLIEQLATYGYQFFPLRFLTLFMFLQKRDITKIREASVSFHKPLSVGTHNITLLHIVVNSGNTSCVKEMCKYIHKQHIKECFLDRNIVGVIKNPKIVDILYKYGASLSRTHKDGMCPLSIYNPVKKDCVHLPLYLAIQLRNTIVAKRMVELGANVNTYVDSGTPISYALSRLDNDNDAWQDLIETMIRNVKGITKEKRLHTLFFDNAIQRDKRSKRFENYNFDDKIEKSTVMLLLRAGYELKEDNFITYLYLIRNLKCDTLYSHQTMGSCLLLCFIRNRFDIVHFLLQTYGLVSKMIYYIYALSKLKDTKEINDIYNSMVNHIQNHYSDNAFGLFDMIQSHLLLEEIKNKVIMT